MGWVSCSFTVCLILLRQNLSWTLELGWWVARSCGPSCLHPPPIALGVTDLASTPSFLYGCWDPKSGPYSSAARTYHGSIYPALCICFCFEREESVLGFQVGLKMRPLLSLPSSPKFWYDRCAQMCIVYFCCSNPVALAPRSL